LQYSKKKGKREAHPSVPSAQFIGYSSRKGAKDAKLAKGRGRPHAEDAEAQRGRIKE